MICSHALQDHYKLTQYLRGWGHYYLIANAYQLTVDLDHWIRRRIRMCYWRQWRSFQRNSSYQSTQFNEIGC
ncbi:group II intron maturase-specific domain-containing protein [Pseudoalteromonas sp. Ld20]|uniref:group II intron maturase-specific domain-containing protein n=1 Tax=Pseudoalteromonas sp. Ld20 TaxID=649165 RepID=UPI00386B9CAF